MIGLGRRLSLLEWDTGMVSTIQEVEHDRGTRFNDGKCDAKGRLWAGERDFFGRSWQGQRWGREILREG